MKLLLFVFFLIQSLEVQTSKNEPGDEVLVLLQQLFPTKPVDKIVGWHQYLASEEYDTLESLHSVFQAKKSDRLKLPLAVLETLQSHFEAQKYKDATSYIPNQDLKIPEPARKEGNDAFLSDPSREDTSGNISSIFSFVLSVVGLALILVVIFKLSGCIPSAPNCFNDSQHCQLLAACAHLFYAIIVGAIVLVLVFVSALFQSLKRYSFDSYTVLTHYPVKKIWS